MIAERIPEIAKLTREERLLLACELWDEEFDDSQPSSAREESIVGLLDARMKDYEANPQSAIPWEEFKKKWGLSSDE